MNAYLYSWKTDDGVGATVWSMALLSKTESEAFKTHNQVKPVIRNPNNQHSVLPVMLVRFGKR